MTATDRLEHDTEFLAAATHRAVSTRVLGAPTLDANSGCLVDGPPRIDLLNAWHHSLMRPAQRDRFLAELFDPPDLVVAAAYGRIDLVERALRLGLPVDGVPAVAAAVGAFVVTDLHVACVEALFRAGVPHHPSQDDAFLAESAGTAQDRVMGELLSEARQKPSR
jgi:hypothetical protein